MGRGWGAAIVRAHTALTRWTASCSEMPDLARDVVCYMFATSCTPPFGLFSNTSILGLATGYQEPQNAALAPTSEVMPGPAATNRIQDTVEGPSDEILRPACMVETKQQCAPRFPLSQIR